MSQFSTPSSVISSSRWNRVLISWVLALRLKTLTAAFIPILVASALARSSSSHFKGWISFCSLGSILCLQIATNLFNDALDFAKGADTKSRLGPARATQSGWLTPKSVMLGGLIAMFLALAFGVPLVYQGGLPILVVGLVSLFFCYAYTGGPFPLAYHGLGDLFVLIFFGLVAVNGVFYLHTSELTWNSFFAGFQIGLLSTVLIVINNFRDYQQDATVNKNTLVVRWGPGWARFEIGGLLGLSYALGGWWWWKGYFAAALAPLLTLPLGIYLLSGLIKNDPGLIFNRYLAQAAALQLMFGFLLSLGLSF